MPCISSQSSSQSLIDALFGIVISKYILSYSNMYKTSKTVGGKRHEVWYTKHKQKRQNKLSLMGLFKCVHHRFYKNHCDYILNKT